MTKETKQLAIITKIDSQLQMRRADSQNVFPLSPTHRKELRKLKSANIGDLRFQVKSIRRLKEEEFIKKYQDSVLKEVNKVEKNVALLNKHFLLMKNNLIQLISKQKELEEKHMTEFVNTSSSYGMINGLDVKRIEKEVDRKYSCSTSQASERILRRDFHEKYDSAFLEITRVIDDLTNKYEEAINFGDLEMVKEIYYFMKNSDQLFVKIKEMEV